jgi:hypothetical protein
MFDRVDALPASRGVSTVGTFISLPGARAVSAGAISLGTGALLPSSQTL